jgi:hypothetical protein
MKKNATLALLLALSFGAHAAPTTLRYDIHLANGTRAGEQVVETGDDGVTTVRYIFKDNGRGPELTERLRMAPDGSVLEYAVKGNSTFGAVVDDTFERKDGVATWRSTTEKGSKPVTGAAMYLPLNSSSALDSFAITALANKPGTKMPLLPSGALSMRVLDRVEVSNGAQKQTVQLLAATGVGLSPSFYWATTGASPRLFARIVPGYRAMTEAGWKDVATLLTERQKKAEATMLADLATRLQHPMPGLTVVRNARVFNSDKATLSAPSDVYVLRGRITAVLPAGSQGAGADAEIDAAGRVMLPGLFDMHGHVGRWDGGLHLAAGVTTVRDMGNDNASLQEMLDEAASGRLLSPQVVPAGFLEGKSKYSANNGFVINDLDAAKKAIDWYAGHGYPQLKIYNSFPKEILKETVAYAHQRGLHVSGHVPVGLRAHEALDAGFDELNHINQVMLNFLATPQTETRSLDRFILPSEKTGALDFKSPVVKSFISRLKMKGTVIDPTLATFAFLKQKDGDMNTPFAAVADHMPPDIKRGLFMGSMKIADDAALKRYEKSYAKMVDFVGLLYKAGVPIVAGTDELAGFTLQGELELLVQAGLTPAQAIQVATKNGAKYTRTSGERGAVVPGQLADLLLIDGEPTKNIADIRKVAAVITRGQLIYPHEIHKELGIVPFVQNPPQMKALAPSPASSGSAGGHRH